MQSILPFATVTWMVLAAIGGGLATLRVCGLLQALTRTERLSIGFVIGIGLIGWLAFFPGVIGQYNGTSFAVILAVMTAGLVFEKTPARPGAAATPFSALEWLVLAAIVSMLVMDLCEGLSPAADADTMAYHFETPRRYLAEGSIYAIPRALDGVSQLLLQMTYGVALGLGGKPAVPLWTMVSGWGLGALFFVLARRHVSRFWALTGTLCLMTTPAVMYSSGSGHIEVRAASFALLAAYAGALSVMPGSSVAHRTGWIVLAGFVAGFFAGTKVTGLIFAFAVFVSVLGGAGTVRRALLFSLATALSGIQWYLFNWAETGDPLYPLLWKYVDLAPGFAWNEQFDETLHMLWAVERPLPRSLIWFVLYPFRAIYFPPSQIEALRTGLGPACVLLLPFAILAFARVRRAVHSPLFRILTAASVFYAIWYFFGPSQRIRHLLVIYPIIWLCIIAGTARLADTLFGIRRIIIAGMAMLIAVQLGGQAIFSKKFVEYLISGEATGRFLESNINAYPVVEWLTRHLSQDDRVLVGNRDWLYELEIPYNYSNPYQQDQFPVYPAPSGLSSYLDQITSQKITHLAIPDPASINRGEPIPQAFISKLDETGCIRRIAEMEVPHISSRTLPQLQRQQHVYAVFKVDPEKCPEM